MKKRMLNEGWRFREAPLYWDRTCLERVRSLKDHWYECSLPADVRMPMIEKGDLRDPAVADYCREGEWIEQRSWWFFKNLELHRADYDTAETVELVLEQIDACADVFFNGVFIGSHQSVHYPFVGKVRSLLKDGENEIAVRVTHGMEKVTQEMLSELNFAIPTEEERGMADRGDIRRAFVRRPQYSVGWDWGPKVITCGLTGDVYLRSYEKTAIRDIAVETVSIGGGRARLKVTVNVEDLDIVGTRECSLTAEILFDGRTQAKKTLPDLFLTSGYNYIEVELTVEDPKLWWPAGYGQQPLYSIRLRTECEGTTEEYPEIRYGIRTIKLETPLWGDSERMFTIVVNDVPVYCKGGDWIPCDSIYCRVTEEKYETLLSEAEEAGFNMLRVWGGGLYERDCFYRLCDEKGILLWQDFMFACAVYPDNQDWWCSIVEKELEYQTRRLRSHSSIALFCGNNENHGSYDPATNRHVAVTHENYYGLGIQNYLSKEIIRKNCPYIPYWNSSPYGGKHPHDQTAGNNHLWRWGVMNPDMSVRISLTNYDTIKSKFVAEYGYIGPCSMETTREYLGLSEGEAVLRSGRLWEMHTNTFEKETVNAGIQKHYTEDPEGLTIGEYLLYGGMVQSRMLEYSLEAFRFKEECSGSLFWMYNDTWGEVGWTIIDYYTRRKIAFYGVKRAFAPKKVSVREKDGRAVIQAVNDGPESLRFGIWYGYLSFDGKVRELEFMEVKAAPHSRNCAAETVLPDRDYRKGGFVVIPEDPEIAPVMLYKDDVKDLEYEQSRVRVLSEERIPGGKRLRLAAEGYVHGCYIRGNYKCSDNYFDILAGQEKTVEIYGCGDAAVEIGQVR